MKYSLFFSRKVDPKLNNFQDGRVYQSNYSNDKLVNHTQGQTIHSHKTNNTKTKTNSNKKKSFINHSMSGIKTNHSKKVAHNQVAAIPLTEQQS